MIWFRCAPARAEYDQVGLWTGQGRTHIDMVYIYLPAFRVPLCEFGIAISGFSSEMERPKLHKLGVFLEMMMESIKFEQNWVLFF